MPLSREKRRWAGSGNAGRQSFRTATASEEADRGDHQRPHRTSGSNATASTIEETRCGAGKKIRKDGGVPTEIRTLVTAVKGRCPGPLDDGDVGAPSTTTTDRCARLRVAPLRRCWRERS